MFLERIRKKLKKSVKHWCITELGHEKSERLHLHGIFWGCGIESIIREKWQNGFIFVGNYVSQRTINYITKYMLKTDLDHPMFKGKVLCSAGIGSGYEMGIKQQGRGMGLQAAAIASQIDLNNSQAEKNRAEAKKTSTVDTQLTEAQTDYTNSLKRLTDTKENTEAANYNLILQKQSLVFEQARNLAIRTDIDEATKQTQIDKVFQDFYLGQITAIEKITNIVLTEAHKKKLCLNILALTTQKWLLQSFFQIFKNNLRICKSK